jgi:hypothetical protein
MKPAGINHNRRKTQADDGEDNMAKEQKVTKGRAMSGLNVLAIRTLRLGQQLSASVTGGVGNTDGKRLPSSFKVWEGNFENEATWKA